MMLTEVVTQKCSGQSSNMQPLNHQSYALTTTLLNHPTTYALLAICRPSDRTVVSGCVVIIVVIGIIVSSWASVTALR